MGPTLELFGKTAAECNVKGFLGFKPWYQYLFLDENCTPQLGSFTDVWKIGAAILEILLRFGGLIAVFFIFWGAFSLMMAQGEPERIKSGKDTIVNAIVGLVIAVLAATIVSVIAGSLN